jgi:hypothetical protein
MWSGLRGEGQADPEVMTAYLCRAHGRADDEGCL